MLNNFTNWFKKANDCKGVKKSGNCKEVLHLMQLIIDDEASEEEKMRFQNHVDKCTGCFDQYQIDKSLLEEIKSKISGKSCPEEVVNLIRKKIKETP